MWSWRWRPSGLLPPQTSRWRAISEATKRRMRAPRMHTRALIYGTAAAVAAASTRCSLLEGLAPQPLSQNEGFSGRFAAWEQRLSNLSGNLGDRIDIEVDGGTRFAESRKDKQFIWQTLREGDRRIKQVAMWRKRGESELVGKSRVEVIPDEIKGISQITLLVELGDELNGHPGIIHGGFTAALLDDLFGWASMSEKRALGIDGMILTANLNVNYRMPVSGDNTYTITVWVDRVEKQKKVFMNASISDIDDNVLVEASALYIIKPVGKPLEATTTQ